MFNWFMVVNEVLVLLLKKICDMIVRCFDDDIGRNLVKFWVVVNMMICY